MGSRSGSLDHCDIGHRLGVALQDCLRKTHRSCYSRICLLLDVDKISKDDA